ncbi:MAG: type II secretion system protein GspN [Myxococcota bacterium]
MLKWILGIAVGAVWFVLICAVTWWVTFPSQAVVDRAAYEVQKASKGSIALKASSSSPWWAGLSLHDATLLSVKDGSASPVLLADSVSARTSIFSLISGGLPIHGVVQLQDSQLIIDAELDRSQDPIALSSIKAEAPKLSVQALGALLAPMGASMSGSGDIELDLNLDIGKTAKDHDGRLRLDGESFVVNLTIPDPLSGGAFELGDINVGKLDLVFDVKDGKAVVKKGTLRSDLADLDLDLTLTLNDNMQRSRMRGTLVVGNVGGQLKTFEGFMRDAKWDDGKYHYTLNCSIDRIDAKCIRAERQRKARTPRASPAAGSTSEEVEARREKARLEREERRKLTAEQRANSPSTNARRPGDLSDDEEDDDEDDLDDEEMDEPLLPEAVELVDPMIVAPVVPMDPAEMGIPNPNFR